VIEVDWPPDLQVLKDDQGITDTRDDTKLDLVLDAAVAFVERVRRSSFNFTADPLSELPEPTADLVLGTVRLAYRWHTRRRSPDALVTMADLGASRIPSFDPDIDRMLGIGRFARMGFA